MSPVQSSPDFTVTRNGCGLWELIQLATVIDLIHKEVSNYVGSSGINYCPCIIHQNR